MAPVTETELKAHQEKIGGKRVTLYSLKANIAKEEFHVFPGSQLTVCVLTLLNGFTVTGESACADPAMFNKEIGQKIARENAERKIWPLMGYALKEEMMKAEMMKAVPSGDFRERVKQEANELLDKITKLATFINGSVQFDRLPIEECNDLRLQLTFMTEHYGVLMRRINRFG